MTFQTQIQILFGAHSSTGSGALCIVDWSRQRAWIFGNSGYNSNINLISGVETSFAAVPAQCNASPMGLDALGNLYLSNGGLHSGGETQIDGTTFAQLNTSTWATNVFGGGGFACVPVAGAQYMIDTGPGGSFGVLSRVNVALNTSNLLNANWTNGPNSVVSPGPPNAHYGFMINGGGGAGANVTVTQVQVYPTQSTTDIATINATSIDASWTSIGCTGICIDHTDGNPIACFTGSGSSTKYYVTKLNKTSGAIIWSTAMPSNCAIGAEWQYSTVIFQKLYVVSPSAGGSPPVTVTTINTSNGTTTSYTTGLSGMTIFGGQISNDSLGVIVVKTSYLQGSGTPLPLNSTPSSFGDNWAVLYVAPALAPPVASGTHATFLRIWGNYHYVP